jgi:precorrin-8X/cobalt-precorrin-8 methylmutase
MVAVVRLFDRYIVVDWSAANTPRAGADSIWVCCLGADGGCVTRNPRTRGRAADLLRGLLAGSIGRRERVLAGFDFPLGYPAGLAAALGLAGTAWRAIWDLLAAEIADDPDTNHNNRFEVADELNHRLAWRAPFWGRPRERCLVNLPATRDVTYAGSGAGSGAGSSAGPGTGPGGPAGLAEWRLVEQLLRDRRRWPHSVWKLLGAGSAGSQALTGIPVVAALRGDPAFAAVSRVWPFEPALAELTHGAPARAGLRTGEPAIVHAEVWPSLHDVTLTAGTCKDEKQVRQLAAQLSESDRTGALAEAMCHVPGPAAEEGWILGVRP